MSCDKRNRMASYRTDRAWWPQRTQTGHRWPLVESPSTPRTVTNATTSTASYDVAMPCSIGLIQSFNYWYQRFTRQNESREMWTTAPAVHPLSVVDILRCGREAALYAAHRAMPLLVVCWGHSGNGNFTPRTRPRPYNSWAPMISDNLRKYRSAE